MYGSLAAHVQGVLRTNTLELKRFVFFVILSQNKYSPFLFIYFMWAAGSFAVGDVYWRGGRGYEGAWTKMR